MRPLLPSRPIWTPGSYTGACTPPSFLSSRQRMAASCGLRAPLARPACRPSCGAVVWRRHRLTSPACSHLGWLLLACVARMIPARTSLGHRQLAHCRRPVPPAYCRIVRQLRAGMVPFAPCPLLFPAPPILVAIGAASSCHTLELVVFNFERALMALHVGHSRAPPVSMLPLPRGRPRLRAPGASFSLLSARSLSMRGTRRDGISRCCAHDRRR